MIPEWKIYEKKRRKHNIFWHDVGMMRLRLEGKADPNLASADGGTPLFMAIQATWWEPQSRKSFGSWLEMIGERLLGIKLPRSQWSELVDFDLCHWCHSRIRLYSAFAVLARACLVKSHFQPFFSNLSLSQVGPYRLKVKPNMSSLGAFTLSRAFFPCAEDPLDDSSIPMTSLINANRFATLLYPTYEFPILDTTTKWFNHHVQHQMLSCWNPRSKQDDVAINHHFENNPKPAGRPLQSCGAALVRWETQHFGLDVALLFPPPCTMTPRRLEMWGQSRPQWRGPKHADTGFGTQNLPAFFQPICLRLTTYNNPELNMQLKKWYIIVSPWNSSISGTTFGIFGCFKVQFLTLALLHKGESAWSLDIVAGHEDFTCKNHQRPYYGI